MKRIFLVAGEASGDKLGQAVMRGLKQLHPDIAFAGVGGPLMEAEGLQPLFPMAELSVMGLAEVLPKYRALLRRKDETVAAALAFQPDILLTIDSPDFCKRVAKDVRAANPAIRTVHYVAPSVWAWRPKRAARLAEFTDKVLTLLPFEPELMRAAGMAAEFTGHPVVAEPEAGAAEIAAFRAKYGLGDAPLLLLLPGSRMGEVTRLSARFGAAAQAVLAAHKGMRAVVVVADAVQAFLAENKGLFPPDTLFLRPEDGQEKRAAFAAADVALAASGTVSLELAAAGTPMVIGYDMAWLSRVIMARMLLIDTVTLVNLVSETRAVPERIGKDCTAERLAEAVLGVLAQPQAQAEAARLTMERLGKGGEDPGLRAAKALLS
ncbi:lipid-A-disaccharide synthase [uncultured Lentibacter sp.]|uniref:lipid-A-disaccharide synthase n=1 Tax=uncultured Lentibacter sp. TaxID=1659309 RepID=UPI00260C16C3|nr:lipid-A-disaccharide synthase [uncultured Lentibacter sp.]